MARERDTRKQEFLTGAFLYRGHGGSYVTIYNYMKIHQVIASNGFVSLYINDTSINLEGKDFINTL